MSADVRKLLQSARQSRRITSPYAQYSLAGALFCTACNNLPIKSETLWDSHIKTQQHKANVANKPIPATNKPVVRPGKRGHDSMSSSPKTDRKRVKVSRDTMRNVALPKGFFDNENEDEDEEDDDDEVEDEVEMVGVEGATAVEPVIVDARIPTNPALPSNFFDNPSTKVNNNSSSSNNNKNMDDEWEAFQADIATVPSTTSKDHDENTDQSYVISAAPVSAAEIANVQAQDEDLQRHGITDELIDAQNQLQDFFEEQSTFEERVKRLKERREQLRLESASVVRSGTGAMDVDDLDKRRVDGIGEEKDNVDDDDEEDEDDDFDRWARGGI